MTTKEANKIIAEFMGWSIIHNGNALSMCGGWSYLPSESLDVLPPVWEKLGCVYFPEFFKYRNGIDEDGKTLQEGAAIATAKAIKKLED